MVTVARRPWLTVAALVLVLASGTVYAHRGATGIVKKRMDAMVSLGSAMKALTAMMRGKQAYDAERVKAHAGTIAGHGYGRKAGRKADGAFPQRKPESPIEGESCHMGRLGPFRRVGAATRPVRGSAGSGSVQ